MTETAENVANARPNRKNRFDTTERRRIRAAIQRYVKAHGIGAPTLQLRIAEATDRSQDLIPLKTLQRFLAGATRTNDAFTGVCAQFVETLPSVDAEIDVFALAASDFFQPPAALTYDPMVSAPELYGLIHTYENYPQGFGKEHSGRTPAGEIIVDSGGAERTLRIRERLFNPKLDPSFQRPADDDPSIPLYHYEGFIVTFERFNLAVMRNKLTGLPRVHWIANASAVEIFSHCIEAVYRELTDDPMPITGSVLHLKPATNRPEDQWPSAPQNPAA